MTENKSRILEKLGLCERRWRCAVRTSDHYNYTYIHLGILRDLTQKTYHFQTATTCSPNVIKEHL